MWLHTRVRQLSQLHWRGEMVVVHHRQLVFFVRGLDLRSVVKPPRVLTSNPAHLKTTLGCLLTVVRAMDG